jgi:OmpA-OmpF porin, OOP family
MKQLFLLAIICASIQLSAQDLKPTETHALLNVLVVNDKKKPQEGETVSFIAITDSKKLKGTTGKDGKFSILIPIGQKYKVRYKAFSEEKDYTTLEVPASARLTFDYTIIVTPPRTFTLDNVFFDSGKSTLRSDSYKELNELAEYMSLKKDLVIEIAGHTDNVGAAEANQTLSEERAKAVKQYLEKRIAPERIIAQGYGDTQPVADNSTSAGKQKNRRTEVRIVSE